MDNEAQANASTLRLVLAYAAFASLWILFSDTAMLWLFSDPAKIEVASILKGWLFVAVTSLLLYGLVRRLLGQALALSRREHEAQTQKSRTQQLLAAIVDSSGDAIFAKDMDGRYLLFNRESERLTGKPAELVVGSDDTALFPPAQAAILRANDRNIIIESRTLTYEETLSTVDGERIYLATKGPLRDGDGHIIGLFGISRDITERKRAEYDVRTLSRAMEQSPASIVITDRNGRIEYVNPCFERVTGYTRAEVVGSNPNILKSGTTPVQTYQDLWRAISQGGEWHGELCNRRKSGELFWEFASISGVRGESGEIEHYIAVKEDITARKRADAVLNETQQRLSAVFQASPIAIIVGKVADGRFLEWNDAALNLLGYARDEVIGRTAAELGTYVNPARRAEMVQRLEQHGSVDRFPVDFRTKGGEIRVLEVSGCLIELQGERCLVGMMLDVTERQRLEQVHLQAQKLESLGTLAAGIAHDFNNILAAIRGNADLAAKDVGPDHAAAQSLGEIRKAGVRASELVRRITAFGRPVGETRHEVASLSAVVDEVLKLLRSTLPAGIALKKEFARDTPHVLADAGQVHEAIVNLTTNAAYAIGSRSGAIAYRLEPVDVDAALTRDIPGLTPGRYARLTVTDSGCGMDAATLNRIFDVFYTTKPVGEGIGLGLSMVHGIMRGHGGAVTVESTPGMGSGFALYFPAAEAHAQTHAQAAPAAMQPAAGQRVLYVDDEEALVLLASRALTRLGHSVSGFTDPETALEAFRAHPQDYDAVVTDLSMPRLSGFELARELLALRPGIPVMMTTGYIRGEDEQLARAAGIRELVLKPVTMDELAKVLDAMIRGAAQGA